MESNVTVKGRQADTNIIKNMLPQAVEDYEKQTGKSIVVKLDTDSFLPADTCGGVELTALNGRIRVPNTLESRLDLISQQLIPEIRTALFGRNVNRKFAD